MDIRYVDSFPEAVGVLNKMLTIYRAFLFHKTSPHLENFYRTEWLCYVVDIISAYF